uniref:Embryonic stem cell-specific 5-hydroxymethylcytosine-binding protein n=2 Tax=Palpitomonas bilix TaxID=652834 RepID=A0A7S3G2B4_9EUKA|mmetsp:Transcript_16218/g.41072  ORF Transcript_16218/g.41072 Transcript_16218/m.41072 type:complete len:308 (+) Transcript_16218:95-1018(+)
MCGRTVVAMAPAELAKAAKARLDEKAQNFEKRYNNPPGARSPVVLKEGKERIVKLMTWGLIPSYSKDGKSGFNMINARAESVAEKPAFRRLVKNKRCVVPISGFYEWLKEEGNKKVPPRPFLMYSDSGIENPLFLAGLFDRWRGGEEGTVIESFTIITTAANKQMAWLHDRMPAILATDEQVERWLDNDSSTFSEKEMSLLTPFKGELKFREVSRLVSNVRNETAQCILPKEEVKVESPQKKGQRSISAFFKKVPSPVRPAAHALNCPKKEEEDGDDVIVVSDTISPKRPLRRGGGIDVVERKKAKK